MASVITSWALCDITWPGKPHVSFGFARPLFGWLTWVVKGEGRGRRVGSGNPDLTGHDRPSDGPSEWRTHPAQTLIPALWQQNGRAYRARLSADVPAAVGPVLVLVQLPSAVMTDKTRDKHAARAGCERAAPCHGCWSDTRWKLKAAKRFHICPLPPAGTPLSYSSPTYCGPWRPGGWRLWPEGCWFESPDQQEILVGKVATACLHRYHHQWGPKVNYQ